MNKAQKAMAENNQFTSEISDDDLEEQIVKIIKSDAELREILQTQFDLTLKDVKRLKCIPQTVSSPNDKEEKFYSLLLEGDCDAARLNKLYQQAKDPSNIVISGLYKLQERVIKIIQVARQKGMDSAIKLPLSLCRRENADSHPYCFALLSLSDSLEEVNNRSVNLTERIMRHPKYGQRDLFLAPFVMEGDKLRLEAASLIKVVPEYLEDMKPIEKKSADMLALIEKVKQRLSSLNYWASAMFVISILSLVLALFIGIVISINVSNNITTVYGISTYSGALVSLVILFFGVFFAQLSREIVRQIKNGEQLLASLPD